MNKHILIIVVILVLPTLTFAQARSIVIQDLPAHCQKLNPKQQAQVEHLLQTTYPHSCCDKTLHECLQQKPLCNLVWRLTSSICRQVAQEQPSPTIQRILQKRAQSMMPSLAPATIVTEGAPVIGNPQAPVVLVEYACARCPFCSKITPLLYEAILHGSLKDKVKMYFKVFPIRNHPYSKESGLAFLAAHELQKFWAYVLHAFAHFDEFEPSALCRWAQQVGLQKADFSPLVKSEKIRANLIASKKEGIQNKVDATPTFFINNRKYYGELSIDELVDVLEEEWEKVTEHVYVSQEKEQ